MISTPKRFLYSCEVRYRCRIRAVYARQHLNKKLTTANTEHRKKIQDLCQQEEIRRAPRDRNHNRSLNLSVWRRKWVEMTPVPAVVARNLKTATGNKMLLNSF